MTSRATMFHATRDKMLSLWRDFLRNRLWALSRPSRSPSSEHTRTTSRTTCCSCWRTTKRASCAGVSFAATHAPHESSATSVRPRKVPNHAPTAGSRPGRTASVVKARHFTAAAKGGASTGRASSKLLTSGSFISFTTVKLIVLSRFVQRSVVLLCVYC